MKTLRMIGVCRTPMWYTRHVFRNRQFMHSESHWIAIKVDVISLCDITWMETCVCKHEKDVKSHWNSVFAGTSNLSLTVYLVISITKRYYRKGLSQTTTLTNHGSFCSTDLKTSSSTAFRIPALHNSPYRCSVLLPPLCYFRILCHFYSEPSLLAVWIGNVCEANCPEWKPAKSITTFMKECV